jgi:hypothetical protein
VSLQSFRFLWIVVLILAVSFFPQMSVTRADVEEGVTVETEGISPILNDDKLEAEQIAITDALRNALDQVVGTLVSSETETKNYEFIQETIKARTSGYVSNQEVLRRWVEDGYYRVLVRVTVKQDALKQSVDALKLTLIRAGKPRLMVLVPNINISTQIVESMKNAGFPVVDSRNQAEILIIGRIRNELISKSYGVYVEQTYLSLEVNRADSGQTMASKTFTTRGVDIIDNVAFQKALDNGCNLAVDFLKEQLGKQLVDSERTIQLMVNGINYSGLQQLQRRIKATPNVNDVFLRSFNKGNAQFDIETGLLPDQLADFISGWQELNLEITSISGSKIELRHKAI